jgi:hypothetical protein
MTPKEKAIELVDKFQQGVKIIREDNDPEKFYAIQCALIAVDEMLKQCFDYRDIDLEASYDYWLQVKQEIQAL